MKRPETAVRPSDGLLLTEHFQVAYATNDMTRARQLFQDQYGIGEFRRLEGPLPAGGHIHVELAWVGTVMYELLTAEGPGSELYVGKLSAEEFAIRHHHLGFMLHNETQWNALMDRIRKTGATLLSHTNNPGFLQSCFVDAPELGHYLEYFLPEPAGLEFLESVPGN